MSDHSFNPFIAEKYGDREAIFINNMIFWTRTNAGNNNNYHNDRYWSYGTPEFFSKYFPYWSERKLKTIIENCVQKGALLKGNFNVKGYDRTNWYSLSDEVLLDLNLDKTCLKPLPSLIRQKSSMDYTKIVNALDENRRPIPDTKPDTKPDKKTTTTREQPNETSSPPPIQPSSSEVIFNKKTDLEILSHKSPTDERSNEEFLLQAKFHIEHCSDKQLPRAQRIRGFIKLLQAHHFETPKGYVNPKLLALQKEFKEKEAEFSAKLGDIRSQKNLGLLPNDYPEPKASDYNLDWYWKELQRLQA